MCNFYRVGRLERVLSGMIRKKAWAVDSLDSNDTSMFKGGKTALRLREAALRAAGAEDASAENDTVGDAPEVRLDMYYDKKGKDFR